LFQVPPQRSYLPLFLHSRERKDRGKGGEMTQTLYAHINKTKKLKKNYTPKKKKKREREKRVL
jgi:hypothetical protein